MPEPWTGRVGPVGPVEPTATASVVCKWESAPERNSK